ncbi:hypothetical protein PAPYR_6882 [Paratrimastix pyriformis]|uniref:Uncharacterized protein n=1 Tax=Paratrimastix pyriformis TaxID=342808 RepID=A0ABQ8UGW0_9EUKA|nr:hypothetical protein PAPYR_6882 [Paratrimastix pyriformis]
MAAAIRSLIPYFLRADTICTKEALNFFIAVSPRDIYKIACQQAGGVKAIWNALDANPGDEIRCLLFQVLAWWSRSEAVRVDILDNFGFDYLMDLMEQTQQPTDVFFHIFTILGHCANTEPCRHRLVDLGCGDRVMRFLVQHNLLFGAEEEPTEPGAAPSPAKKCREMLLNEASFALAAALGGKYVSSLKRTHCSLKRLKFQENASSLKRLKFQARLRCSDYPGCLFTTDPAPQDPPRLYHPHSRPSARGYHPLSPHITHIAVITPIIVAITTDPAPQDLPPPLSPPFPLPAALPASLPPPVFLDIREAPVEGCGLGHCIWDAGWLMARSV